MSTAFEDVVVENAKWFARLSEDQQVEFLKQSAIAMKEFIADFYKQKGSDDNPLLAAQEAWFALGSHISNCPCTKFEAKEMMAKIMEGIIIGTGR